MPTLGATTSLRYKSLIIHLIPKQNLTNLWMDIFIM